MKKKAKELFQILPLYNSSIEKPKIKHLSKIESLHELPLYDKLSVVEISKAFRRYARSYKVEIIDTKDHLAQLEASKSSILLSKCAVCDSKKLKFMKQQQASGLLSSLGIKTPLHKIPLVGPLLF